MKADQNYITMAQDLTHSDEPITMWFYKDDKTRDDYLKLINREHWYVLFSGRIDRIIQVEK